MTNVALFCEFKDGVDEHLIFDKPRGVMLSVELIGVSSYLDLCTG